MKDLAVVILNWNGKHWLEKFLSDVISKSPEADVIIIDNGSTDNSIEYLKSNFTDTQLILLDNNYGFCGGYNKGLKELKHKYFLLLNSDIEVTDYWLKPLLTTIKIDDVGIVQPKILDYKDKTKFEYAGASGGYLDKYGYPFCRGRIFDSLETDKLQHQSIQEIVWATGAAMLIKSELWHILNGLDEIFFAHMEEIDLCWRAQNSGYKVMVNPESTVYHFGGGTLPKNNPRKTFLNFRNGLFLLYKNLPKKGKFKTILIRMILDGAAAFYFLINGLPKDFWAVFRAHIDFYKKMNTLKISSNRIMPNKTLNSSVVIQHFLKKKQFFKNLY